jgi:hypothetical protein
MSVGAVRAERHDDLGAMPPQLADDAQGRLPRIGNVEPPVRIAEQRDIANPERLRRGPELRLPDPRERLGAGVLALTRSIPAETARVPARGGDQEDIGSLGSVARERAAEPERFVVGMGEHGHQPPARTGAHPESPFTS